MQLKMSSDYTFYANKGNIMIPATSVPIKITNVRNPYFMKMHLTKNYVDSLDIINRKLSHYMQKKELWKTESKPHVGNLVIVHSLSAKNIDLPAWFCRGSINSINFKNMTYNVFLVDHGTSVIVNKEDFIVIPHDLIPDKYLTYTVGLYNVVPAVITRNELNKALVLSITEKWTDIAIQFTKQLIASSDLTYFDSKICDESGKQYGELYFKINDEVVTLSKAIIENRCGVYLEDLSQLINGTTSMLKRGVHNNVPCYFVENLAMHNSQNFEREQQIIDNKASKYSDMNDDIQKVLIYSSTLCGHLNSVVDVKFPAKIHKVWDSLVNSQRPTRIQSYMWPAIREGLNVLAVGPSRAGKTFGYTFALTGLLATYDSLPRGNKPTALILCSSSSEVLTVHSLCKEFLQHYNINSVSAFTGKSYRTLTAEIFNGSQILVSTPRFLVQFIKKYKDLLNFEELSYLILDSADIILDKYFDSIAELFSKYDIIQNREWRNNKMSVLQIIVTTRHITARLKKFAYTVMYNPYICITSFIEAAIFKSVRPKLHIVNSTRKVDKILDLLKNECNLKTMIVCATIEEAKELHSSISQQKQTLLIHERKHLFDIQVVRETWRRSLPGSHPILICTDEVLSDLNVTDVDWLIHYSVLLNTKTRFNFRFTALMQNLQKEKSTCEVTIFVDERNNVQFLSIVKMLQRMGVVLSNDMVKKIEQISVTLDNNKKAYPICDNVKAFGFCSNKDTCVFRHCVLPDVDIPMTNIEIGDKVKIMITYIHEANHFSARIIEYTKSNTREKIEFPREEYIQLSSTMQSLYGNIQNRRKCATINVGDIYALEYCIENFQRVQVLCIREEEKNHLYLKFADVRCIDTGNILRNVETQKLLWIPEELAKLPSHIVEVFIAGIAPCDEEYTWNNHTNATVFNWFKENFNEHSYIIGTVLLHLGNTIWVETLQFGTKLVGYPDVIDCSLKTELLNKSHAVERKEHIKQMYNLCKDSGLICNSVNIE